jgi:hypothetical protein
MPYLIALHIIVYLFKSQEIETKNIMYLGENPYFSMISLLHISALLGHEQGVLSNYKRGRNM